VQCGGYEISIFFDFEVAADSSMPRFRRLLLTEEKRKSMSECLIAAVSPKAVMRQLNRIDEACEAVPQTADVDISQGPFGAFRSATEAMPMSDDFPDWSGHVHLSQDADHIEEDALAFSSGTMTPRTTTFLHSLLELAGGDLYLPNMPMWSINDDTSRIQDVFGDGDIIVDFPDFQ
jgi:arginine metabolism regulation protein II